MRMVFVVVDIDIPPPPVVPPTCGVVCVVLCSPIKDMLTSLVFTGFFKVKITLPEMISPGA